MQGGRDPPPQLERDSAPRLNRNASLNNPLLKEPDPSINRAQGCLARCTTPSSILQHREFQFPAYQSVRWSTVNLCEFSLLNGKLA